MESDLLAHGLHFLRTMFFHTPTETSSSGTDWLLGLRQTEVARGPFSVDTLERVRNALIPPAHQPLTRADWAELRNTVSARRPSPPPRLFPHADLFFDR